MELSGTEEEDTSGFDTHTQHLSIEYNLLRVGFSLFMGKKMKYFAKVLVRPLLICDLLLCVIVRATPADNLRAPASL